MKEEMDIESLITDYLTGELDAQGAETLKEWISASDENARIFVQWKEAWIGAGKAEHKYDKEAAFRRFKRNTIDRPAAPKQSWLRRHRERTHHLTLMAAAIFMPLLMTCSIILYLKTSNVMKGEVCVSTVQGEHSTVMLPDGTEVKLEENTRLTYTNTDFAQGKRDVDFCGRAYFKVKKDKKHPFVINTKNQLVKVLGTQFNLIAERNGAIDQLLLDKGQVEITNFYTGDVVTMNAGDELTYNCNTHNLYFRTRSKEEMQLVEASRKNQSKLVFADMEVVNKNNEGYSIQLTVNNELKPGVYTVDVNNDKTKVQFTPNNVARFDAGNGTKANPYIISNPRQLCNIKSALKAKKITYFALDNDIDLHGIKWEPLNSYEDDYALWISFDGRNHVIRNLSTTEVDYYGSFFGVLCGECRNVGFENVSITSTGMGSGVLGGYIGHSTFPGTTVVENCYFTGSVCSKNYVGAIGGNIGGPTIIRNCHSNVDVSSLSSYAGGIIGKIHAPLTLEHCYVGGSVTGLYAGGVIGGGQEENAPRCHYKDVIINNRSIFGSKESHITGFDKKKDKQENVIYSNNVYLNGTKMTDGQPEDEINKKAQSWPRNTSKS